MKPGDKIEWKTVHGVASGIVKKEFRRGEWYVALPSGKVVIVTEGSAKKV